MKKCSSEAFGLNVKVLVCIHLIFVVFNHLIQSDCRDLRTYTALLSFTCSSAVPIIVVLLELCGLYFGCHLFPLVALVRSAAKKHCITPALGDMIIPPTSVPSLRL